MLKQYKSPEAAPQISFNALLFAEEPPPLVALVPVGELPSRAAKALPKPQENLIAPEAKPPWTGTAQLEQATEPTETATKADQARQRVEEGLAALAAELEAGHSGALLKWLDAMSHFHSYSLNNTLLIAWQRPEATHVGVQQRFLHFRAIRISGTDSQVVVEIRWQRVHVEWEMAEAIDMRT